MIATSFKKTSLAIGHFIHRHQNYGRTERQPLEEAYIIGLQLQDTYWDLLHGKKHIARMVAQAGHVSGTDLSLEPTTVMHEPFETVLLHLPKTVLDVFTVQHDLPRIGRLNLKAEISDFDPPLFHMIQALLPAIDRPDEINRLFADHLSQAMIVHIIGRYGGVCANTRLMNGGLSPWQLRVSKEMIDARLDSELTLTELAALCKLSVSHFSRGFTRSTGMAPHRWLMQRWLEKAKHMMLKTQSSLAEIALACGFADQAHMTRVFSTIFSVSPGAWRRNSR